MVLRVFHQIVISAATALVVYIVFLVWSFYYGVEAELERFESHTWKERSNIYAASNDPGCVRGGMALDLLQRKLLHEKTMNEVEILLGHANKTEPLSFTYDLGQCSGLGWNSSVLNVKFKENGRANHASIERDIP